MAPLLSWRSEYSTNTAKLDSHHIKLFDILNTTYENVMNSTEVDCIITVIDELLHHTRYHFLEEEQHMREKGEHEIEAHREKHRELTQAIETLKTNYQGNSLQVTQELIILLGNWLLRHVLAEHKKCALESE